MPTARQGKVAALGRQARSQALAQRKRPAMVLALGKQESWCQTMNQIYLDTSAPDDARCACMFSSMIRSHSKAARRSICSCATCRGYRSTSIWCFPIMLCHARRRSAESTRRSGGRVGDTSKEARLPARMRSRPRMRARRSCWFGAKDSKSRLRSTSCCAARFIRFALRQ